MQGSFAGVGFVLMSGNRNHSLPEKTNCMQTNNEMPRGANGQGQERNSREGGDELLKGTAASSENEEEDDTADLDEEDLEEDDLTDDETDDLESEPGTERGDDDANRGA